MKKLLSIGFLCVNVLTAISQNAADFKVFTPAKTGLRSTDKLLESLIGEGVVLKNYSITKTSGEEAFGFFEDSKERLGMKKGLVMTTGGIIALSSKNTSQSMSNNTHERAEKRNGVKNNETGCKEIEEFLNHQKTFDACVIEFDIVPTADTLSFNYVFGSEEYDEFVGSTYNDAFAFLISGKGITSTKNLAVVPNTDIPVTVNSINNGSGSGSYKARPSNSTFYVTNTDGHIGIEYDGMTKLMQIRQPVVAYETYHVKLAIADVGDDSYDSGVFIEGKSFVSYDKTYNVLYTKNKKDIEPGYKTLLDNLSKEYKKHPQGKILITGHTDEEGEYTYNMNLSCERSTIVSDYLKSKGIPSDRIVLDCKGETMPTYDNTKEKGKQLNRRVEIKLSGNTQEYAAKKIASDSLSNPSLSENKSSLIKNFPNPFQDMTTLDAYLKSDVKDAFIKVSDINGKLVKTIHLLERGNTNVNFDGQSLSKGIYTATLYTDGLQGNTLKIILQ